MKDAFIDIEMIESTNTQSALLQLPQNCLKKGIIGQGDVRVYMREDVYTELEKLACSDTKKELGSILLGSHTQQKGETYVLISAFIEAKYTDATASTLTFTHDTWNYIHCEQDRLYPGLKIVGWQHTHPGYGVFLSGFDLFIQENFFNLPFQIAYVIDPIRSSRGFFQWKNNKVDRLGGFHLYHDTIT